MSRNNIDSLVQLFIDMHVGQLQGKRPRPSLSAQDINIVNDHYSQFEDNASRHVSQSEAWIQDPNI